MARAWPVSAMQQEEVHGVALHSRTAQVRGA